MTHGNDEMLGFIGLALVIAGVPGMFHPRRDGARAEAGERYAADHGGAIDGLPRAVPFARRAFALALTGGAVLAVALLVYLAR